MGKLSTSILQDGGKNATIQISGMLDSKPPLTEVLVFSDLMHSPTRLKLEACIFAIQEKAGVHIWWRMPETNEYLMTLESRGRFDFEALQGIISPEGAKGMSLSFFNWDTPKGLFLLLDFNKA